MLHGWKARIHHLTRRKSFLMRTSLIILIAGFVMGCAVQLCRVVTSPAAAREAGSGGLAEPYRRVWRNLGKASEPAPRELLRWLRHFLPHVADLADTMHTAPPEAAAFLNDGTVLGIDVRALIEKHARADAERGLFTDFIVASLAGDGETGAVALHRIQDKAGRKPVVPYANEMLGHLWQERGRETDALAAFIREGGILDAKAARESALRLAIEIKDAELLRDLMNQPAWAATATSWMRSRIGSITGDYWLLWKGLIGHQFETMRWGALVLTLLATGLWYIIFTQHSDKGRWRWALPVLPIIAGVCSIWPTLIILGYQEYQLGMTAEAPFPHDLWYYLAGVGLREELSKLALAAFFMPYLLWRRSACQALLTGAFVGLGFAMEENLQYYSGGGGIAWARFLTANFMHASMTGIITHALYETLRTRFGQAEKFVGTFLTIVIAHGLYDYVAVSEHEMSQLLGISFFSIIILALLARHFFQLLADTTRGSPGIVSPASVFLIGSSLLIAILFITAGFTTDDIAGIAAVGSECVGVAPVAYLFWKTFEVR